MNRFNTSLAGLCLCLGIGIGVSVQAGRLDDPAADDSLDARFKTLAAELRCLVCQNQTIADSNAALAVDLRNAVQRMLREGATDAAIVDYMVARYGDFVLYRPPVKSTTLLLWAAPALFLLAGLGGWAALIRSARHAAASELSAEQRAQAAALLDERAELRVEEPA